MKKAAWVLLLVAALILLAMQSCKPKPKWIVIRNFQKNKDSFVTVAEYIESFEWEGNSFGFGTSSKGRIQFRYPDGIVDTEMLGIHGGVAQSVYSLLRKLGYQNIERTRASKNTIIFEVKPQYLSWEYYNQGICYVIDGGEPTPELNLDYYTEYIEPLGDNWYYWNGHCYFP